MNAQVEGQKGRANRPAHFHSSISFKPEHRSASTTCSQQLITRNPEVLLGTLTGCTGRARPQLHCELSTRGVRGKVDLFDRVDAGNVCGCPARRPAKAAAKKQLALPAAGDACCGHPPVDAQNRLAGATNRLSRAEDRDTDHVARCRQALNPGGERFCLHLRVAYCR